MLNKEIWEGFLNSKVAINCPTEEDANKFMQRCEKNKLLWSSGEQPAKSSKWEYHGLYTCYISNNGRMEFARRGWYEQHGYDIKTFKDLGKAEFKGWEILKMITEGKLKKGDRIIIGPKPLFNMESELTVSVDSLVDRQFIKEVNNDKDITSWDLINRIFTIQEKEYMTFDEARKSRKRFKYKNWKKFYHIVYVMAELSQYGSERANKMLDEKAWEVEDV